MMPQRAHRGFGLLEILIAAVVIGLGIVALTSLQGKFLKSASATSQREVALKLAQAKLDDLRGFTYEEDPDGFGFDEIADDAGGRSADLAAGTSVTFDKYQFGLGWDVVDYKLEGGSYVATTDPADKVAQKAIVVNVSWTDASGVAQTLSLPHTLSPTIPDTGTASSGGDAGLGGTGPTVTHLDAAAPDVIDIDLGDGSKRETSKPLPEVNAGDGIVLVQFDSINFDNSDSQKIVQEDNLTVSCSCTKSSSSGEHNNPVQLKWADEELYWEQPAPSSKPTGTSTVEGDDRLAVLCNRCCADHFDRGTGGANRLENHYSYDSGRWGNERFFLNDKNEFTLAGPNKTYLEACRMMRINGYYVLMPDWQQVHQEVMTRSHLEDPNTVEEYQGIVKTLLRTFSSSSLNYETNPNGFSYQASGVDIPQRSVIIDPKSSTRTQFMGRAVYVDPIENYDTPQSLPYNAFPFHEVNNTLLADWALYQCSGEHDPLSLDPTVGCTKCDETDNDFDCGNGVKISNQPVAGANKAVADSEYYTGYYSRGELSYRSTSSGHFLVEVSSRKSNSGVTGTGAISPYDEANVFTRYIGVSFGDAPTDPEDSFLTVGGRIYCVTAKVTGGAVGWTACKDKDFSATVSSTSGSCPNQPDLQGNTTPSFGCNLPDSWLDLSDGKVSEIRFTGANATFSPAVLSESDVESKGEMSNEFCVVMVLGDVPDGAEAPTSCDYNTGV